MFGFLLTGAPPRVRRWLVPPQRQRAVPWSGAEVVVALVFVLVVWPVTVSELLIRSGFYSWIYGPTFPATGGHPLDSIRRTLWVSTFAVPAQIATILLLFYRVSDTRLYQLGLTWRRAGSNVVLGVLGWLVVTPPLYTLLAVLSKAQTPEDHPLTRLSRERLPGEWLLVVVSAVILVPVLEELLFRGVLQPFFARRSWGGLAALLGAVGMATLQRAPGLRTALQEHGLSHPALMEAWPILYVLLLLPAYLVIHWRVRSLPLRAIVGTAVLFGAAHSSIWPTPIPLTLLGLVLGWMAYRTQSLVGPIVLHALFNLVASLQLILGPVEPPKGNDATKAAYREPAASTSSGVPGSWLPRRT